MDNKTWDISDLEVSAILAALPLVLIYEKDREKLVMLRKLVSSLSQKLLKERSLLNSMEQQLVYNSAVLAEAALKNDPEFQLDPQTQSKISPYFFVYPSLIKKTEKLLGAPV